jgi:hypothetical protein
MIGTLFMSRSPTCSNHATRIQRDHERRPISLPDFRQRARTVECGTSERARGARPAHRSGSGAPAGVAGAGQGFFAASAWQ